MPFRPALRTSRGVAGRPAPENDVQAAIANRSERLNRQANGLRQQKARTNLSVMLLNTRPLLSNMLTYRVVPRVTRPTAVAAARLFLVILVIGGACGDFAAAI